MSSNSAIKKQKLFHLGKMRKHNNNLDAYTFKTFSAKLHSLKSNDINLAFSLLGKCKKNK